MNPMIAMSVSLGDFVARTFRRVVGDFMPGPAVGGNHGVRSLATDRENDYCGHYDQQWRHPVTHDPIWPVAEAKARFSEVIDQARGAPQTITRNGKRAAIVVSVEEWDRRNARSGTLADFLAASPLRGAKLRLDRARDRPRDIDL
jgi:prevent-host-death family protein